MTQMEAESGCWHETQVESNHPQEAAEEKAQVEKKQVSQKELDTNVKQQCTKLKIDLKLVREPFFKFGLNLEINWEIT